jgi:molybdopterin molybdotransferase
LKPWRVCNQAVCDCKVRFQGREWEDPESMLGVDVARERILAVFSPLEPVEVGLADAVGLVLAHDVVSQVDLPPFRNSAMDGYALRSEDTLDAPTALNIVQTIRAGAESPGRIGPGQTARIMTGAAVPEGADAVIRFEETDERTGVQALTSVTISRTVQPGENVRLAGEVVSEGDVVLTAGSRLRPPEIGLLAALEHNTIVVHRQPRIGVLSTGDELVASEGTVAQGMIRDSNAPMLAAAIRRLHGEPIMLGVARDSTRDLLDRLGSLHGLDMLITTGGVSVGDYDMVKQVLQTAGTVDIWQVRMKPGKPLAFGRIGDVPVLGLPGNPVAALVSFEQFARPAIQTMLGRVDVSVPEVLARNLSRVENRGGRRHFVRGNLLHSADGNQFESSVLHGSANLLAMSMSNSFMVIPESVEVVEPGDMVSVQIPDEGL